MPSHKLTSSLMPLGTQSSQKDLFHANDVSNQMQGLSSTWFQEARENIKTLTLYLTRNPTGQCGRAP